MVPFIYKSCVVLCLAGILSMFLFACNSSREASREADSAAVSMPSVDSTSVVPVDTTKTKPDSTKL
ncbi:MULTISPECIES: hypothetical protein [Chitinophaga]|uniref:hypothetical protein n=1 Tax=Chitinophaga TaxID=79328 RepID=UPI00115A254E|nr:hypothetical protein [Chitinophaga polysaccharea]